MLSCCEGVMSCSRAEEPSSSISEPSHCREHENTPFTYCASDDIIQDGSCSQSTYIVTG